MQRFNCLCLLLAVSVMIVAPTAAQKPNEEGPVKVLVVSGVDFFGHLFKETGPALRKVMEKDERLDVRLAEEQRLLASDAIFRYEVIFLHFRNDKPFEGEEKARENLARFIQQGGGLVVFHFASGAFKGWDEFKDIAGRVWITGTSKHDKRGPFDVKITDVEHPITQGISDFETDDELYHTLQGDRPIQVLATAKSNMTGEEAPMVFVFNYGKGRVAHIALGHDVKAIEVPEVAELIRRSALWVGNQQL